MNTDTPVHPSGARSAPHDHWTMGPLPRILAIATVIVGIGFNRWATETAPAYIGWSSSLLIPIFFSIPALILAWAAKPREEKGSERIVPSCPRT